MTLFINWSIGIGTTVLFLLSGAGSTVESNNPIEAKKEEAKGCKIKMPDTKGSRSNEYYYNNTAGEYRLKQSGGYCNPGTGYCTYFANQENPDVTNPDHFTSDEGSIDKVWIP